MESIDKSEDLILMLSNGNEIRYKMEEVQKVSISDLNESHQAING